MIEYNNKILIGLCLMALLGYVYGYFLKEFIPLIIGLLLGVTFFWTNKSTRKENER